MPNKDVHIYIDDDTGFKYIFDGTNLVRLPDDSGSSNGSDDSKQNQNDNKSDENDSLDDAKEQQNKEKEQSDKNERKPQIGDSDDLSDEDAERERQAEQEREEDGEEETPEERKARLDRIKRYLSNDEIGDQINYESEKKVSAEKQRKKAAQKKEIERNLKGAERNAHVISLLGKDLKQFLGKLLGKSERNATWRKYNANYANVGLIRPGYRYDPVGKIPVIQIYLDQSGSWGEDDIKLANDILKSIKEFEDKNLLKVQVYYFANHIYDNAEAARDEGGTRAGSELMQQLNEQKPENVIVITDSDFDHFGLNGSYTAPGGVWMVFRAARSEQLIKALKGRLQTKIYDIDRI